MKISNFGKTNFFSITFPFIDDFALNIHEINDFLKFWPLMAFFGLHWPFWSFWPWMNFLSKDQPLVIKIKQNWAVSNHQMSKPNCESKSPIYSTVLRQSVKYWEQRETGLLKFIADVWKNYLAILEYRIVVTYVSL